MNGKVNKGLKYTLRYIKTYNKNSTILIIKIQLTSVELIQLTLSTRVFTLSLFRHGDRVVARFFFPFLGLK